MDGISKLFLDLRQSKAALEQAFYRSLDSSVIRSGLEHGTALRLWEVLGEGRHFQCFKLPGRGELDLAVLLAKPGFLQADSRQRRAWAADLQRLRSLNHPLVPPMEVMEDAQFFAYVQPCCEAEQNLAGLIQDALHDLHNSLARIGLELDDYPQLRRCQGHPFVIDFSELKRCPTAGFRL
ncbi:MAG TPA: hypothetical protein VE954_36980 [Oligoflexus sp.]|uniref:hypothetical protein n=1 Tax=Oligoflexus sp. TaxID=1971216 RepID=UPI002D551A19|nr:hypothetical protein [Oligoflexus sp.]HYX38733.1 hypothetical protein [Oligoflexus sp.]